MGFTAKLMAERTQIGDRQSISEGEYMCHVFVRADSLIGVCLSDQEYPKMVAHKLLTKVSAKYVIFSVDYILKTKAYPNKFEIMRQSKS